MLENNIEARNNFFMMCHKTTDKLSTQKQLR